LKIYFSTGFFVKKLIFFEKIKKLVFFENRILGKNLLFAKKNSKKIKKQTKIRIFISVCEKIF